MTGQNHPRVQLVSRAYFEAEFGPVEHRAEIGPVRESTPAFLVPRDERIPDLKLRPIDPPPEAA